MTESPLLKKLKDLLDALGVQEIEIHQIGFLMMYFPFYMVLQDLKNKNIKINFSKNKKYKDDDKHIVEAMLNNDFESLLDNGNMLQIGICEPILFNARGADEQSYKAYERNTDFASGKLGLKSTKHEHSGEHEHYSRFFTDGDKIAGGIIHIPFINFPPLYGVALVNNPKINRIKRDLLTKKSAKTGATMQDYWRHFSAKMSILQRDDFKGLVASLYPKGSTTDWFIRREYGLKLKGKTWILLSDEFADIFNGHADVAFTVQPWAAVPYSKSKTRSEPMDIEIVYKSRCYEYDCTSLLFKTKSSERLVIGEYVLRYLYALIHEKIRHLYHDATPNDLNNFLASYCEMVQQNCANTGESCNCSCCKCKSNKTSKIKGAADDCLEENKVALQLILDSQIYKQRVKSFKDINCETAEGAVVEYFAAKYRKASGNDRMKLVEMIGGGDMTDLKDFERCLLEKHQTVVLGKIFSFEDVSLSGILSKMIGKSYKYKKSSWSFFGVDRHNEGENKYAVSRKMECSRIAKQIDEYKFHLGEGGLSFRDVIEEYHASPENINNSWRKEYQRRYLYIEPNKRRFAEILPKKAECGLCGKEHEIKITDVISKPGDDLYIPPILLDHGLKLNDIFAEIATHSFCDCINSTNGEIKFNIICGQIKKTNTGKETLYFLIFSLIGAKAINNTNGINPVKSGVSKFKSLCDYLILVADNNGANGVNKILPLYCLGRNENLTIDAVCNLRGNTEIQFSCADGNSIKISNSAISGFPEDASFTFKNQGGCNIHHIFVFDNTKGKPEEDSRPDSESSADEV